MYKGHVKAGKDPAGDRKAHIAASAERRGRSLDRLLEEYARALPKRMKMRGNGVLSPRQAAADLSHARAAVASMACGSKPASDVTVADLRTMLRVCGDLAATARHRFGALSRFFDWAQDEGFINANPCLLMAKARRPRPVAARQNYLTLPQLAELWTAAEQADGLTRVHRDLVRIIIAIPCRRSEAALMDWSHLDLDASIWSQPASITKNGDPHRFHLHSLALIILKRRHEEADRPKSGLVFPSPRVGRLIDTFSDIKAALAKAAPDLPQWRFHDVRRSFVTTLGEAGIPETIADAILNHRQSATRGGVLGVYQRAQRWPEQVSAMTGWGDALAAAIADAAR
jgi:integrase